MKVNAQSVNSFTIQSYLSAYSFCKPIATAMVVEAYSPVAHGQILNHPEIVSMAEKYDVTVAQLCIRYCLQLDALPLPKSASLVHMQENAAVDFVISDADMELLKNMEHIKDYGEHSVFPVFSGK